MSLKSRNCGLVAEAKAKAKAKTGRSKARLIWCQRHRLPEGIKKQFPSRREELVSRDKIIRLVYQRQVPRYEGTKVRGSSPRRRLAMPGRRRRRSGAYRSIDGMVTLSRGRLETRFKEPLSQVPGTLMRSPLNIKTIKTIIKKNRKVITRNRSFFCYSGTP